MVRALYAAIVALVGAAIVHITVLLLLPNFSDRDAWARLAEAADYYKPVRIDAAAGEVPIVRSLDPLFYASACRFDLSDGPVRVHTPGNVPYWSVSIYNRGGQSVYAFTDRATDTGQLDVVVLSAAQMIETRKQLPDEVRNSILVEAPVGQGIVVVRSFVPDISWQPTATRFLRNLACSRS